MWIIAIITWKSNCKKEFTTRKTWWIAVSSWLLANSGPESHNEESMIRLGNSNDKMCLQDLNLSTTQSSAFHHDLAFLQQAMNAVRVCSLAHKSENMNAKEWLILPSFVVGGLVIIHSIDVNWRIRVIKPFHCLYHSKFFLPQNRPPPRLRS